MTATPHRSPYRRRVAGDLEGLRAQLEELVHLRRQGGWDDEDALRYELLAAAEQRLLRRRRAVPRLAGGASGMA